MIRCVDSVTVDGVVWGRDATAAPLVLGYVDGRWATYEELVAHYRGQPVRVVPITTGWTNLNAKVIDVEVGNAHPVDAARWAIDCLQAGRHPTFYGGADSLDECWRQMESRHYSPGLASYWLAKYVQVAPAPRQLRWPHLLPRGRQAWQFADSIPTPAGHTFDASVVSAAWCKAAGIVLPPTFTASLTRGIEVRW